MKGTVAIKHRVNGFATVVLLSTTLALHATTAQTLCKDVPAAAAGGVSFGNVVAGQSYAYSATGCVGVNSDGAFADPDGFIYTNGCSSFWTNDLPTTPNSICPRLIGDSLVRNVGGHSTQLGKHGSFIAPSPGELPLYLNDDRHYF